MKGILACTAILSIACATASSAQNVTVERIADKRWRATFHSGQPVTALVFERPASFFRERVFTVVGGGYHLARRGDMQLVTLDSGVTPRRDIAFEFAEFTDALPKEYELFQPFTDGSVAIYTGHFHATLVSGKGDSTVVRTIRFETPPAAHAVVHGNVVAGAVTIQQDELEGTYVYLGVGKPVETNEVVAIIDPGMPSWLRETFDKNLPLLFREYLSRFGQSLPAKPVLLLGYEEKGSGRSSGGGTLTGLINMVFSGADWKTKSPAAAEQALHLIAHESAHMWNGQLVQNSDQQTGSWMHEGGADAMANEMLYTLGTVDSVRHRVRLEEALNRCIVASTTGSLAEAGKRNAIRQIYDCGLVMALWSGAAVARAHPGDGMFTFWRMLAGNAISRGHAYGQPLYFETLSQLGASAETIERMKRFVTSTDSASLLLTGLADAGIPAHALSEGAAPAAYGADAVRRAFAHLMSQACNGRMSFSSGSFVRTSAIETCAPFSTSMRVFRVQGLSVATEGVQVYDAVRSACAAARSHSVQMMGQSCRLFSVQSRWRNVCLGTRSARQLLPPRARYGGEPILYGCESNSIVRLSPMRLLRSSENIVDLWRTRTTPSRIVLPWVGGATVPFVTWTTHSRLDGTTSDISSRIRICSRCTCCTCGTPGAFWGERS